MKPTHLPSENDIPNIEYAQVFTASSMLDANGRGNDVATFDLTIREMPGNRNFMLLAGIEEAVNMILNWSYKSDYVDFLEQAKLISPNFARHLREFKFTGDVWAIPEGTLVFPGEPVVRITAPLKDANLFTAFLTIAICYPTLFLTKAARIRLAAGTKYFFVNGATRANSFENVFKLTRLSHAVGSSLAMPYIARHFGITKDYNTELTLYHALIKSFPSEEAAFKAIADHAGMDAKLYTMVDTYDFKTGLKHFIEAEHKARKEHKSLGQILIDSGDLLESSRYARQQLDAAGLTDVAIAAEANLDEYKIATLEASGAPIDIYGAVTEVITVSDHPALDAVYKLAELVDRNGEVTPTAKLTPGKVSLPGRKQVFRNFGPNGLIAGDVIGLEDEHLGEPLMVNYIKNGKPAQPLPDIERLKRNIDAQLTVLPEPLKSLKSSDPYTVAVSDKLQALVEAIRRRHAA